MEDRIYLKMADLEDKHWWFVSKRKIIETIINKYIKGLNYKSKILDAGCGTGSNFLMLSKFSKNITMMEYDENASKIAEQKYNCKVYKGSLPSDIPFNDNEFDLIVLLDVLEHIDNDKDALIALKSKLKPEGYLLITVPAFNFLWSSHDESHHHKRRYKLGELNKILLNCGFEKRYCSYYNFILFPLIVCIRFIKKLGLLSKEDDLNAASKIVNYILTLIMSSESHLLKFFQLPFGVSIISVYQKLLK
ncbi:MAG: class I SAM-dependent methyltransferase [Candidatus Gastranaerophilales bacterium]|nr:class I SAM-dependent methyltransferase [Candidatus Gastranaerophilales bacterium]